MVRAPESFQTDQLIRIVHWACICIVTSALFILIIGKFSNYLHRREKSVDAFSTFLSYFSLEVSAFGNKADCRRLLQILFILLHTFGLLLSAAASFIRKLTDQLGYIHCSHYFPSFIFESIFPPLLLLQNNILQTFLFIFNNSLYEKSISRIRFFFRTTVTSRSIRSWSSSEHGRARKFDGSPAATSRPSSFTTTHSARRSSTP